LTDSLRYRSTRLKINYLTRQCNALCPSDFAALVISDKTNFYGSPRNAPPSYGR